MPLNAAIGGISVGAANGRADTILNLKVFPNIMLLTQKTWLIAATLLVFILCQSFFPKNDDPIKQIKAQLENGLEQFSEAVESYNKVAQNLENTPASVEQLKKIHLETRLAYKNIELWVDYLDPYSAKRLFNGAPLPTVEPNVPVVQTLQPLGLQVLDDLVFGENPTADKSEILRLLAQLKTDFSRSRPQFLATPLTHRHVFEASRRSTVRIFTLGVTGFDTPGSQNALPEAAAAFASVEHALRVYMPLLEQKDRGMAILLDARLSNTSAYLAQNKDFDAFDRLTFLTQHVNPIYELIYQAQRTLGIETVAEVETLPQPVRYEALNLFEPKFLNAGYYANLKLEAPETERRAALGRLLFFDPVLSENGTTSCATCHRPNKAFTDGLPKSLSNNGTHAVKRNAPTLLNCVYSEHYFYDLREPQLARQILHVVRDSNEFNTDYLAIAKRLSMSAEYVNLFKNAYPNVAQQPISGYTISDALATYVANLTDFDSPFDQYVTGKVGEIAPATARGFNLFMGKAACGTCHFAPVFNGTVPPLYVETEAEVLGVPSSPHEKPLSLDPDEGRYANQKPRDRAEFYRYAFKTPTVRNSALTAPYMHNGAYPTLASVVDFYNKGGGKGLGLVLEHQTLPFDQLNLTAQEQSDLVAFMESLTGQAGHHVAPDSLPKFDQKPIWNGRYSPQNYK